VSEPGTAVRRAAYTVPEVAGMYGISESHVRRLIKAGTLAKVPHMGVVVRISPDELARVFGPLPYAS
jgi:excisionase family DNA binding protein